MTTTFQFASCDIDFWIYGGAAVAPEGARPRRTRLERQEENPAVRPVAEVLEQRILGQDAALERLVAKLSRLSAGLNDPMRPLLTALLMGPTGVGKSETAKALSRALFGWDRAFVRIDCEEYSHGHEIAKLLGSPPGYVGHNVEPLLSQRRLDAAHRRYLDASSSDQGSDRAAVDGLFPKRNARGVVASEPVPAGLPAAQAQRLASSPAAAEPTVPAKAQTEYLSIVLFDEVEKAHPKVWDALLGVLEDGVLTLGDNSEVSFRNSIILMTSNVGSRSIGELLRPSGLGFGNAEARKVTPARLEHLARESARRSFPAEFLNRLDVQLVYSPLATTDLSRIFDRMLSDLQKRILERGGVPFLLKISDRAKSHLVDLGTDTRYGARPLRRVIESELVESLSTFISTGRVVDGDVLEIDLVGDQLEFFRASRNGQQIVS